MSNLSDLLSSLVFGERIAHFFKQKTYIKHTKKFHIFLTKIFWANRSFAHLSWVTWANCSFVMSHLRELLMVAHLSWATWAIRSQLLIFLEQSESELIACSRSFDLSEMSKWAMSDERMSDERMSEFPALLFLHLFPFCNGHVYYFLSNFADINISDITQGGWKTACTLAKNGVKTV